MCLCWLAPNTNEATFCKVRKGKGNVSAICQILTLFLSTYGRMKLSTLTIIPMYSCTLFNMGQDCCFYTCKILPDVLSRYFSCCSNLPLYTCVSSHSLDSQKVPSVASSGRLAKMCLQHHPSSVHSLTNNKRNNQPPSKSSMSLLPCPRSLLANAATQHLSF